MHPLQEHIRSDKYIAPLGGDYGTIVAYAYALLWEVAVRLDVVNKTKFSVCHTFNVVTAYRHNSPNSRTPTHTRQQ